jgi:hypothetical protein
MKFVERMFLLADKTVLPASEKACSKLAPVSKETSLCRVKGQLHGRANLDSPWSNSAPKKSRKELSEEKGLMIAAH